MTSSGEGFVVHGQPVWRDSANFVIHAKLRASDRPHRFEQLWTRQLGDDEHELCCIPFFLYDLALGDVVRTRASGDLRHVFDSVIEPSGRFVFRVWLGDSFQSRNEIADDLESLGALLEWSSSNLVAVDAEDANRAHTIADYLDAAERRGDLVFETGRSK